MTKSYMKNFGMLALLMAVAVAPATMAFAQNNADADDAKDRKDAINDLKDEFKQKKETLREEFKQRQETLKEQIREEIKTGKDLLRNSDRSATLQFDGTTSGWAVIAGSAHPSSIVLSGDAYQIGGANWKVKSNGTLTVADRVVSLDLAGHARSNLIVLQGTGTLDGEPIRVHLKGHFAPTGDENVFAIAFTNASVQYLESGIRVQLMQVGSAVVTPVVAPTPPAQ